jgi:hypothetical protein
MLKACRALVRRALVHDLSKYSRAEAPYFERALPFLRRSEYGSSEYKAALAMLGPALDHHYLYNSHHPEFYDGHVDWMSPLDQIEMLCDHRAATRRHATGDMRKSMEINAERWPGWGYYPMKRAAVEIGLVSALEKD